MPARFLTPILLLLYLILTVAACTREPVVGHRQVIDGINVLIYGEEDVVPENPYLIEERMVFGTDQSEDTYLLSGARPAALGPDGSLYVVEIRETTIHRFAADGTHIGRFGRQGEGPGEFLGLSQVLVDNGSIYFPDYRRLCITVTDLEGAYERRIQVNSSSFFFGRVFRTGSRDSRSFITCGISPVYPRDDHFKVSIWDDTLESETVLLDSLLAPTDVWIGGMNYPPFHPNSTPRIGAHLDMPVAWYAGDEFRIDYLDPLDRSRWAVIIPHEAIPVTSEMKDQYLRFFEMRGVLEEARRVVKYPDYLPHASSLIWDTSGRLWVKEYQDPTVEEPECWFHVFSREGEWLFRHQLPVSPYLIQHWCIITGSGYYVRSSLEDGTPVIRYYEFVEDTADR